MCGSFSVLFPREALAGAAQVSPRYSYDAAAAVHPVTRNQKFDLSMNRCDTWCESLVSNSVRFFRQR
jgi:hypothetical protein